MGGWNTQNKSLSLWDKIKNLHKKNKIKYFENLNQIVVYLYDIEASESNNFEK